MTTTPISSVTLAVGAFENVTVLKQDSSPVANSEITWSSTDILFNATGEKLHIVDDLTLGGFHFLAVATVAGTMKATHVPTGLSANLPVTITGGVTSLSFATVS